MTRHPRLTVRKTQQCASWRRASVAAAATPLALVGVGLALQPAQAAQPSTQTLRPTVAAWYQPDPACATAVGCLPTSGVPTSVPGTTVPLSPYPAGSMHIGWSGGQETARSYLGFTFDRPGPILAATLDIPLDDAVADGSQSPDQAVVQVCLFYGDLTAAEGSLAAPPRTDCTRRAAVNYVALPKPHLHADLQALVGGLITTGGVVLLPDPNQAAPAAWRTVFNGPYRGAPVSEQPSLQITLMGTNPTDPEAIDAPPLASPSVPPASVPLEPADRTGLVAGPTLAGPSLAAPSLAGDPLVPDNGTTSRRVTPAAREITTDYAYPAVLLVPLMLLIAVPYTARALVRDPLRTYAQRVDTPAAPASERGR